VNALGPVIVYVTVASVTPGPAVTANAIWPVPSGWAASGGSFEQPARHAPASKLPDTIVLRMCFTAVVLC